MSKPRLLAIVATLALATGCRPDDGAGQPAVYTQLYLIGGYPAGQDPGYLTATTLYTMSRPQALEKVREIWRGEEGLSYVRSYAETGIIMLRDGWPFNGHEQAHYKVIRTDSPAEEPTAFSVSRATLVNREYFIQESHVGPLLLFDYGLSVAAADLRGFPVQADWQMFRLVTAQGVQLPGLPGIDFMDLFVTDDGTEVEFRKGGSRIKTGWQLPPSPGWQPKDRVPMLVNNRRYRVLSAVRDRLPDPPETCGRAKVFVYDKSDLSWKSFWVSGEGSGIRDFGGALGGTVAKTAQGQREWPGQQEWNKYPQRADYSEGPPRIYRFGLGPMGNFHMASIYSPGTLFILLPETGSYAEIETNQADSEILLLSDREVYYRVFDTIFRAPLVDGQPQAGEMILQGELVPDLHWAFMGPPWQGTEEPG